MRTQPRLSPALDRDPRAPLTSGRRLWVAGFIALLIFAALAIFLRYRTERELRAMPAAERRALYERTLTALRTSCEGADPRSGDLYEHCSEQAAFIKLFPECDRACRQLAVRVAPKAVH